ncbi:MAG: hypothetical protein IPQ21_11585 [Betaproteobacteria bacterium]|nr:hypothetical protein [Betaproteobacteria bacterium]MBL0297806.1 hypothetical protein [Betaproteobacteria bacterium]
MIEPVHHDLFTRRALGAYTHSSGAHANALLAMSGADTDTKGRRYVVLRDGSIDICAVYRVRNDGRLKRLKRWPAEVG